MIDGREEGGGVGVDNLDVDVGAGLKKGLYHRRQVAIPWTVTETFMDQPRQQWISSVTFGRRPDLRRLADRVDEQIGPVEPVRER